MTLSRTVRAAVALLSFALSVGVASAQQAKMYGSVLDEQGQPVPNAKVILEPIEKGSHYEVMTKGKKGSYLLGIVRAGKYALKVDAPGMVLIRIDAKAIEDKKKEPVWTRQGNVRADQPPQFEIEDGMEITCDAIVGKGAPVTTASGGTTLATPDQALSMLTQQVQKGDCPGALPQLDKFVTDNPTSGRAFYLQGYCNAVLEHDDVAIAALSKSRELDPTFAGTSSLLGHIYARSNKLPEAEAAFRKELENAAAPLQVQTEAWLSLGGVLRDQGRAQDAIDAFEKVKALDPKKPEPYVELSGLYSKMGQNDKAAKVLDEAKQVGADDPVALLNVGISYYNKKDDAHAESMFRRVIDGNGAASDRAMAYGLLGNVQLRAGRNDDAIASYKKCLELDPNGRLATETSETLKALTKPQKH